MAAPGVHPFTMLYEVWFHNALAHHWVSWGKFPTLEEARRSTLQPCRDRAVGTIVYAGRVAWKDGFKCNRALPRGLAKAMASRPQH